MVVRRSYDGRAMSYDPRLSPMTSYDHRWSRMTSSHVYCTNIVRWATTSHDVVRDVARSSLDIPHERESQQVVEYD